MEVLKACASLADRGLPGRSGSEHAGCVEAFSNLSGCGRAAASGSLEAPQADSMERRSARRPGAQRIQGQTRLRGVPQRSAATGDRSRSDQEIVKSGIEHLESADFPILDDR